MAFRRYSFNRGQPKESVTKTVTTAPVAGIEVVIDWTRFDRSSAIIALKKIIPAFILEDNFPPT